MNVTTLRVDSRLVHGQVVETWLPALKADSIVVIDAGAAGSRLTQAAMRLALPPEVSLTVLGPEDAGSDILDGDRRPLILVPSIEAAVRFIERLDLTGDSLLVNVGVVHHAPMRRTITPGVHLSEDELDMLTGLSGRGLTVEVRGLPSHPPIPVEEARALFAKRSPKDGKA